MCVEKEMVTIVAANAILKTHQAIINPNDGMILLVTISELQG